MQTVNPIASRWRREATDDPVAFWERAAESLPWFRKWDDVFDWQPPEFRWFSGAKTNLAYNCIDPPCRARLGRACRPRLCKRTRRAAGLHILAASSTKSSALRRRCAEWASAKATASPSTLPISAEAIMADARHRAHRRDSQRRIRRIRRRRAWRPHTRRAARG